MQNSAQRETEADLLSGQGVLHQNGTDVEKQGKPYAQFCGGVAKADQIGIIAREKKIRQEATCFGSETVAKNSAEPGESRQKVADQIGIIAREKKKAVQNYAPPQKSREAVTDQNGIRRETFTKGKELHGGDFSTKLKKT